MNSHAHKTAEYQNRAIANTVKHNKDSIALQLKGKEPEVLSTTQMQEMANNSPGIKDTAQLRSATQKEAVSVLQKKGEETAQQLKKNNTGLPDNLKSGIESLSGYSMDDVKVHYNSDKPAQLQAHAYAQGTDIHVGSGQEKHLPHEAWHVVQQKQGRVQPIRQLKGAVPVNDDKTLESEADVMGAKALQFKQTNDAGTTIITSAFSSETLQRRKIESEFYGTFTTENLSREQMVTLYRELKKKNANPKTIEELETAMRNHEFKGEALDPSLINDWEAPTKKEDGEQIDLSGLSTPIIKGLGEEEFKLQDNIMDHFNRLIEGEGQQTMNQHVFRLCTVEIEKFEKGLIYLSLKEPVLKVPSGLTPGYRFLNGNSGLIEAIKKQVYNILRVSGQMAYIEKKQLVNSNWRIIVDVDYYYNRPPDAIGFHKDTVGRSLFVNLNFNNNSEILGPEYILNPKPVKEHDEHIVGKLPQTFMDDLMKERENLGVPKEIQSTRIPKKGMVSFVDELVHHSTPYLGHRGFSNGELATLAGKLKVAKRLGSLLSGTHPSKCNDRSFLANEIGLDQDLLNFLFSHRNQNGSPLTFLTTGNLKQLLGNDQRYLKMQQLLPFQLNITKLEELSGNVKVYSHEDLVMGGLNQNFVSFLYKEHGRHDLQSVQLAGCEDHCDVNIESKGFPLVDKEKPRLTRRMSTDLLTGNIPPPTQNRRQFFRTWVQAIKK